MDDEPTGHTIDGTPWEEPQPPHLPDALTGVSPWVIPFLLLAALQVIAAWLDWTAQGDLAEAGNGISIFMSRLPIACASLVGAALFLRHPDAHRRLPMLAFGAVLLAVWSLLASAVGFLDEAFEVGSHSIDEDRTFVVYGIYGAVIAVVNAFGLVYLARGLDGTRRWADVVSARGLGTVLTVVAVVAAVASVAQVISMTEAADVLRPLNVLAMSTNLFVTLAWSYLFVVAFGGWQAGEWPPMGWLLAAIAAGLEVGLRVASSIGVSIDFSLSGGIVLFVMSLAYVGAWVILLVAFVVGLPSTEAESDLDWADVDPLDGDASTATGDPLEATPPDSGAG